MHSSRNQNEVLPPKEGTEGIPSGPQSRKGSQDETVRAHGAALETGIILPSPKRDTTSDAYTEGSIAFLQKRLLEVALGKQKDTDISVPMKSLDREFLEGADLISEDELKIAKNGVQRLEKVVNTAEKEIQPFLIEGDTGSKIQAMFIGIKPVIFDLDNEISGDILSEKNSTEHKTIVGNEDLYRKHLIEVQSIYQRIRDHLKQVDSDIHSLDLAIRDYSRKDDPNILTVDGKVELVEGDHAIYSRDSVLSIFNNHQEIFRDELQDGLTDSSIKKLLPDLMEAGENKEEGEDYVGRMKGLLCGYPYHAVKQFFNGQYNGQGVKLFGREYLSIEPEKDEAVNKRDKALLKLLCMKV